jgi:hypothetical protein
MDTALGRRCAGWTESVDEGDDVIRAVIWQYAGAGGAARSDPGSGGSAGAAGRWAAGDLLPPGGGRGWRTEEAE